MSATLGEKLVTGDEEAPPAVVAKPDDAPPTIAAETDELSNDERWNVLWIIIRIYYLYDSTKAFAIAWAACSHLSSRSCCSAAGSARSRCGSRPC